MNNGGGGNGGNDNYRIGLHVSPFDATSSESSTAKRIFITGATGRVGRFLVAFLLQNTPHHITCLVRDPARLHLPKSLKSAARSAILLPSSPSGWCVAHDRAAGRNRLALVVGELHDTDRSKSKRQHAHRATTQAPQHTRASWTDSWQLDVPGHANLALGHGPKPRAAQRRSPSHSREPRRPAATAAAPSAAAGIRRWRRRRTLLCYSRQTGAAPAARPTPIGSLRPPPPSPRRRRPATRPPGRRPSPSVARTGCRCALMTLAG